MQMLSDKRTSQGAVSKKCFFKEFFYILNQGTFKFFNFLYATSYRKEFVLF